MRELFQRRAGHYLLLTIAHLVMTLPNLGAHSLWDMDEGVNAEAAREMVESGNWITPFYNYELRSAKPALLYWLQGTSYQLLGVNEFAARLPAVLCGFITLLLTYELARRMFSPSTGLLAGITLASCLEFCLISHAATPDPPLLMFTTLTFTLYWLGSADGRRWWYVPTAAAMGLAVLTKGPVGLALPALIIVLHLAATKSLRALLCWRTLHGISTFFAVCAPWYLLVTIDTKGRWTKAFFMNENVNRFSSAMDNHAAGPWFHVAFLFVLFAPWCVFLIGSVWYSFRQASRPLALTPPEDPPSAHRYLLIWIGTFLVVFSVAATKLPNYILPLYPALAIVIARFLDRWRTDPMAIPRWMMPAGIAGLALVGSVIAGGLLIAGGEVHLPMKDFNPFPGLGSLAWIGGIPLATAIVCGLRLRQGDRTKMLGVFSSGAVACVACMGAFIPLAFEEQKIPKYFALNLGLKQTDQDVRIGTVNWYRHSLVFYAEREVARIPSAEDANEWLRTPRPVFIIISSRDWPIVSAKITRPYREVGRRYDFLSRDEIIVISNQDTAGNFLMPVSRP
ncbi:ArnT family glycosyltransferase [Zavarzinella formosa]|uniref:ArnT family glycosyltransferase n=1 Tax=Zavarzinella formosa TaxID=360055 RepID=UPI00030C6797|nr:glycosyltransferase family 39 protein [Zavarzinella formosa]